MILVLFFYVADVFAVEKENLRQIPSLDLYEDLPAGDPAHMNYGVSEFWWEDKTTEWKPWWEKMNVTIPNPWRGKDQTESREVETEPTIETAMETNVTTIVTMETPESGNETQTETARQDEMVISTDTTKTDSTTEFLLAPTAEEQPKTEHPMPEIDDPNLLAQLRAPQRIQATPSPQELLTDKTPLNYDYYGELNDDIPPNVRGPDYSGLLPNIPVIFKEADNKTKENKPPAIPGWRLQFPDPPPKTESPKPETTTKFQVNYPNHINVINDGKKVEPLPEGIGRSSQPNTGLEANPFEKSTVANDFNILRTTDYPALQDMPVIPDSIEEALGSYSSVTFKFDGLNYEQELKEKYANAARLEGMTTQPTILKPATRKALSPTYTVPHVERTYTPMRGKAIPASFTFKNEPSKTTTSEFMWGTSEPPPPLQDFLQTYKADWNWYNTATVLSTVVNVFTYDVPTTISTTTLHAVVEKLKSDMEKKQVGYFTVSLRKFFEIFSEKENNALTALLKGASYALDNINKNDELVGLGRPMWPGTELGFLQMRLAPITTVKSRAKLAFMFFTAGSPFDVKELHGRVDNLYNSKDGENMLNAIAAFNDYPGKYLQPMDADKVMEDLFRALLAPYLRDKNSTRVQSVLKDMNQKLISVSQGFFGGGRRNTVSDYKYNSTINYKSKTEVDNADDNIMKYKDDDDENGDDTSELSIDYLRGNASEHKDVKTEKNESVAIRDSNQKSKKAMDYDSDNHVRMSKVKQNEQGTLDNIIYSTTDSIKIEKHTKKLNCSNDECTSTKSVLKNKYSQNEVRLSDDTRGQIGHYKETKMDLSVKHKVTETTIQYHHDKDSSKNPKKYPKKFKKATTSRKSDHYNGLSKEKNHTKEKSTRYTYHARDVKPNDKKWFLEIIKYDKAKPITHKENERKYDYFNNKEKITRETKYVSDSHKLICSKNNETCTAKVTTAIPKKVPRSKYGKHEVGYGNAKGKVRPIKDTGRKVGDYKDTEISYRAKYKVTEATKFYHYKYGEDLNKYPKTFKNVKKAIEKNKSDGENRPPKDDKVKNTKYKNAKNEEPNNKKRYLEIIKHNTTETRTNKKGSKIGYIKNKSQINRKPKSVSYSYEEELVLQNDEIKSKDNRKTDAISKIIDFRHKKIQKIYDYDTPSDSIDNDEIKNSKIINIRRKDELNDSNMENAKRNASQNDAKAKDYFKELRRSRTTKKKEYSKEIKQFFKSSSTRDESFHHTKTDGIYFRNQNHDIWSSSEKVKPTTGLSNSTENEVYRNKLTLEDRNVARAKNIKNNNTEHDGHGNKYQVTKLEEHDYEFTSKESKIIVENMANLGHRTTKLLERVPQKRFKLIKNSEAKNDEKHNDSSQTAKPTNVNSEATDNESEKNKESLDIEKNKKIWLHSKSQYIINDNAPNLEERFLNFNRDKIQTKTKYSLRQLDKNKNILRVESSYSDEEELLKSNLQDNILHEGRSFTDTLHANKKRNVIRDMSSYSDEEYTLKKNIYKAFI